MSITTVADLQTCLASLADTVACVTHSDLASRGVRNVAESLKPFAHLTVDQLTELLRVAHEFTVTGQVPMPTGKARAQIARTPEAFASLLESLCKLAASDAPPTRERVARDIDYFKWMPHRELEAVAVRVGLSPLSRSRRGVVEAFAQYVMRHTVPSEPATPPDAPPNIEQLDGTPPPSGSAE